MHVLNVRNVHEALPQALDLLFREGVRRNSRYGDVLVMPEPVTTLYRSPTERVIFWPSRDANPFFHAMEALWMLAGRNDVQYVARFAKRMETFSDDGKTFHGAYGFRWKNHFHNGRYSAPGATYVGFDQLAAIIGILKANPDDRRCVLQMWDPAVDLGGQGKDFPCNTNAYFSINADGALDMTVCNRSNDIVWGCYGANAVHFSVLQEYMAGCIGVPVGRYWQMSNNWHGYLATVEPLRKLAAEAPDPYRHEPMWDPYTRNESAVDWCAPFPLFEQGETKLQWDLNLSLFMEDPYAYGFTNKFFSEVAKPMWAAWDAYKKTSDPDRYKKALDLCDRIAATDWQLACWAWMKKREDAARKKVSSQPSMV